MAEPIVVEYTTDHGRKHWRLTVYPADTFEPCIHAEFSYPDNPEIGHKTYSEGIIDLPSVAVRERLIKALRGERV